MVMIVSLAENRSGLAGTTSLQEVQLGLPQEVPGGKYPPKPKGPDYLYALIPMQQEDGTIIHITVGEWLSRFTSPHVRGT
ncbi:hypothetical protein A2115_00395 [Candidatus Woesebacteria bacterium GWA1_41_8]|uniref:Uncharacterized protein n=1 Tax=Candidatus Woesebacteria bacterium GWA1_41_8 TaxID=1802471 RepID=A0A1F7WGD0_9BACT|nr:MAG: hypothetical protein A2115_00395 [Candidatus Woesebacteria bacterium GWA1_41_8]